MSPPFGDLFAEVDAAPAPRPPSGRCAPLSWRRQRLRRRVTTTLVAFVVMAVGFVGERGLDWTVDPAGWLILMIFTLPIVGIVVDRDIAAGADWVRRGRTWVDVYALDEIHAAYDGDEDYDFAPALALCPVVQLGICGVAAGVGNVPMEGGLGAIAVGMVGIFLLFGPVAVGIGLIADRGTGAVVGMAVGVALLRASRPHRRT